MRYFRNVGVAATQFLSALVGLSLNANETTSGAAYRRREDGLGWLYRTINALYFWQDDHCLLAALKEIEDCQELLEAYSFIVVEPHYAEVVTEAVQHQDEVWGDEGAYDETEYGDDDLDEEIAELDEFPTPREYFELLSHKEIRDTYFSGHGFDYPTKEGRSELWRMAQAYLKEVDQWPDRSAMNGKEGE